ncbi:Thioesterase/thiol ester dehydrase-isomerase [Melanomma pulvis-pyrius CBS 109.77]|uniref:Thioesterase/thiol ester dehydrase-isomerase n=1 Tax=Melanomma pulvis-pyrius CBS 109.77 TaxID=1314802 RepID=A0A6A6XE10_9PLEO|nr:Thioesterase/thiol ester dehydrase-isomerase [Melanomma pulvis-pyrius CBS 109.77]
MSLYPVKNASGRYDNVDFTKAAGHKLPTVKVSYLRRDVLLFAAAIGVKKEELHFLYELHPSFAVFPTFSSNLAFKRTSQDVFDFIERMISSNAPIPGAPPFDPQRSVDGERGLEIISPLPVDPSGLDLEIQGKVIGVYDKGGNMILEGENTLLDAKTGKVYTKFTNMAFGIGQGGYGGPRGPAKKGHPPPNREPDAVYVYKTYPEQALLYRLCGDYNPLHADEEFGKNAGFKGSILQGLGTWNIAAHGILMELGGSDPLRFKSITARFASVVYPGETLETKMWKMPGKDGNINVVFQTVVQGDGRIALSNGLCVLKQEPTPSSKL